MLLLSLPVSAQRDHTPAHLDTALTYIGIQEIGSNEGPEVSAFLASVGLNPGYAWCAAFVSFCFDAVEGIEMPVVRSARAQDFITSQSYTAKQVMHHRVDPTFGWLAVFKKGNGPFGHVVFVIYWYGRCGVTVEGNTSSGAFGNQRDGDGVWVRNRCIESGNPFRITHFTPFRYAQPYFRYD